MWQFSCSYQHVRHSHHTHPCPVIIFLAPWLRSRGGNDWKDNFNVWNDNSSSLDRAKELRLSFQCKAPSKLSWTVKSASFGLFLSFLDDKLPAHFIKLNCFIVGSFNLPQSLVWTMYVIVNQKTTSFPNTVLKNDVPNKIWMDDRTLC